MHIENISRLSNLSIKFTSMGFSDSINSEITNKLDSRQFWLKSKKIQLPLTLQHILSIKWSNTH